MKFVEVVQGRYLYKTLNNSSLKSNKIVVNEKCDYCDQIRSFTYERSLVDSKPRIHFANDHYVDNSVMMYCGECPECEEKHFAVFVLTDKGYESIGFYPGIFARIEEVDKYSNCLDEKQRENLVMAIRSNRLGMSVGSFAYIRRLLESLVEKVLIENTIHVDSHDQFKDLLCKAEKVTPLFPDELSDTKTGLYSFLSEGVHKWTDEECAQYYPLVEFAVFSILEFLKNQKEKKKRIVQLQQAIGKMNNEKRS